MALFAFGLLSRSRFQRYLCKSALAKSSKDSGGDERRRGRLHFERPQRERDGRSRLGEEKAQLETPSVDVVKRRRVVECGEWNGTKAEAMLLYKDDDIIAVNKPAGLAVHGGPRLHDDLSKHLSLWQYDSHSPPELAHRLDKDTSGVLLLTRHAESAKNIAELFHERKVIKKYWVITVGVPEDLEGSVKIPIGTRDISEKRHGRHSMNRVVLRKDLLESEPLPSSSDSSPLPQGSLPWDVHMAHTNYKVLSVSSMAPRRSCLLLVQPITGYKHQLRVHLADGLICPVLGDYKFGGPLFRLSEHLRRKIKSMEYIRGFLYLHAAQLELPDYQGRKGRSLVIKAPPPPHFAQTAKMLGLELPSN